MNRIHRLILYLFLFTISCGQGTNKQQNTHDSKKKGLDLFIKYGCNVCHSLEGKVIYGPPLNDFYMKDVTVIRQGLAKTIVADHAYLEKAIADPGYEKVSGYENKTMAQTHFSKEETDILIDYLISMNK